MKHHIKPLFTAIGLVLLLNLTQPLQAASLITNPVVLVKPMALDFGAVKPKSTVTNTFLVENAGGGKLVGKATVPAPFKIISGESYSLNENAAQVLTITYTPGRNAVDTQTVTFTGGGGAKAVVTGKLAGARPPSQRSQ